MLINELTRHGNDIISAMDSITKKVSQLRHMIHLHRKQSFHQEDGTRRIQQSWATCYFDAQTLEVNENSTVRIAAKAIKLILALSWPLQTNHRSCAILAKDLKDCIAGYPGRSCLYMDLSSCHIIIGAIAAEPGSEARMWFLDRLRRALQAMEERGWEKPFGILERTVSSDENLLGRLRLLRDEGDLFGGPTSSSTKTWSTRCVRQTAKIPNPRESHWC